MNRIERLELVVRSLVDRVLGEDLKFDDIAEDEAAEQGDSFFADVPAMAPSIDVGQIVAAILEQTPASPDLSALEARISALEGLALAPAAEQPPMPAVPAEVVSEPARAGPWAFRDLLNRAAMDEDGSDLVDELAVPLPELRVKAHQAVQTAAQLALALQVKDQVRYELAVQARNGAARARELLSQEARNRGTTVEDVAECILAERMAYETLVARVGALESAAHSDIEKSTEQNLNTVAETAVLAIEQARGSYGGHY